MLQLLKDNLQLSIKNKVRLMLIMAVVGILILFAFSMFYVFMTQSMNEKPSTTPFDGNYRSP